MANAALAAVVSGAAQGFFADIFKGDGFDDVGPGDAVG
jgi:hypothetical protein